MFIVRATCCRLAKSLINGRKAMKKFHRMNTKSYDFQLFVLFYLEFQ